MPRFEQLTSISGDMTSQMFLSDNGVSHCGLIFIPGNRSKLKENHILCMKTVFSSQNHTPPPIKKLYLQVFEPLIKTAVVSS